MPEQDDGMSWFDKVKFFISMWIVVFVVVNVWSLFPRHPSHHPLPMFSVESAVITGVVALVITIYIVVTKIPE